MEMYDEVNAVFMPANATSVRGGISTFKSYYLRNTSRKAVAAIDSNSADGSGHGQLKTWKGFTILDTIKNIRDSWEEVKISTLTGAWKKLKDAVCSHLLKLVPRACFFTLKMDTLSYSETSVHT
jgi:hypothetical protein